jgi:hydroxypyruvate isomerase
MDKAQLTRRTAMLAGGVAMAAAGAQAATKPAKIDVKAALAPYACNIDMWFRPTPFIERFALAAKCGFTTVEFWPARREDGVNAQAIRAELDKYGLKVSQFAPGAPAFTSPAKYGELDVMIKDAIADAKVMGCSQITLVGHHNTDGMSREDMLVSYTVGLMRIAPMLEEAGLMALVEPFNHVNHLNFLLNGSRPTVAMCRAVNSPMVKIQWDFFHMQHEEGDLINKFKAGIDQVGYVQLGDVPGRNQPGTGEVNHVNLLKAIRAAGYKGFLGLEYNPLNGDYEKATKDAVDLSLAAGLV